MNKIKNVLALSLTKNARRASPPFSTLPFSLFVILNVHLLLLPYLHDILCVLSPPFF